MRCSLHRIAIMARAHAFDAKRGAAAAAAGVASELSQKQIKRGNEECEWGAGSGKRERESVSNERSEN